MANYKFQRVVVAGWFFFGICIFYTTIIPSFVEGKQVIPEKYRGLEHKGTIKTIVSPEDNDVIDCVDFYKQPAFDDPRIKDFKVESNLLPDETHEMTNDELKKLGLYQNWLKYGECPNGTIPIRRTLNRETYKKKLLPSGGSSANYDRPSHEYAIVEKNYFGYGTRAKLNVWNPTVERDDFSLTQIWVVANHGGTVETIETGWIKFPKKFDDLHTRFFIFWTNDDYSSGCWNLECSGFVQVNKKIVIGGVIKTISTYNTSGYYLELSVHKEERDGDWGLYAFGQKLGYWPNSLFKYLKNFGEAFQWGGEVYNTQPPGRHSVTEMGSGHFPYDSHDSMHIASYVSNIGFQNINYKDDKLIWENVPNSDLQRHVTRPECYNATIGPPTRELGTHFYYGGPGWSDKCR